MGTLYWISVRQLTGRSRMLIIGVLAMVPVLLGLVISLNADGPSPNEMDQVLVALLFGAAVLPIITLTVSTAALGNDLEDRTLSNLTLTPFSRWAIILPKFAASVTVAGIPLLFSAIIGLSLAYENDSQAVIAAVIAMALAIITYSAVFLWLGLATGRALGFGLMYVFVWEFLFTQFVSGLRFLSIRAYMIGVVRGIDDRRFADEAEKVISMPVSLAVLIALTVIFTLLAIRRLRTMDVP
ncbi:MAG: ABC transporter permease subunit [Chloroflexi bacterium]|nr:ABC transporter permease subunit [Chloroflexota bacterium]